MHVTIIPLSHWTGPQVASWSKWCFFLFSRVASTKAVVVEFSMPTAHSVRKWAVGAWAARPGGGTRGEDPRGLGRWVWQLYRGINNRRLRVVTAYRPNQSTGPFTVYA